jgi:outer membrane receptor for ferric coprogen and ferric-rhodotorulic acid
MKYRILFGAINASLLLLPHSLLADETGGTVHELAEVSVEETTQGKVSDDTESYSPKTAVSSTTGLPMSLRETPQSVSVTTRTKMDDFGQNTVNDVLENTTGITSQRVETDRTYYSARGFDINNFQFDSVGMPLTRGILRGQLDTAAFERVEVVRGANGLMTGVGNPSASVNFVRKRPTKDTQIGLGISGGSWDTYRADADMSGSITDNIRGRFVTAYQDGDSYLDRYEKERGVFYGVVEADLTDNTLFTIGYSRQNDNADSPMWGALPLYYTDGAQTDYDVSTSNAADWAYWDNDTENAFAELKQRFDNGWEAKAVYQYRKLKGDSKLFYTFGTPDRNNEGMFSYPSRFENTERREVFDLSARGPYEVGGRVHEMVVGLNRSKAEIEEQSIWGEGAFSPVPADQLFSGTYPEPAFTIDGGGSDWIDRFRSAYLATRLSLAEPLTAVVGARYTDVESEGVSYSLSRTSSASELVPYAGLILDVTEQHSLYVSQTEIFTPQAELKADGNRLDPITGTNFEYGIKSEWFHGRLNTSVVAFETEQENVAKQVATAPVAIFDGQDFESSGYEMEVTGEVLTGWNLTAGYTFLDIEHDEDGNELNSYVPEQTVRLASTYRPSGLEALKLGAQVNWQSGTDRVRDNQPDQKTKQESYAVVNLIAGYDFTDNLSATLRANNVSDEKYLTTLRWDQGFYGAERNYNLSLNWKY